MKIRIGDLKRLIKESMERFCNVWKASNGKWYLDLADREYGEYEDATTYGPFSSESAAMRHLENFSNPGSLYTDPSGKNPPPTKSPNGRSVENPYSFRSSNFGNDRKNLEYDEATRRFAKQAYDAWHGPSSTQPDKKSPNKPSAPGKTYKVYPGTGGQPTSGPKVHVRVKGEPFVPTKPTKFSSNEKADVSSQPNDSNSVRVKKTDSDHTQVWTRNNSGR